MRALITGAGGFVGGHLRHHLVSSGDEVTGVDRECDVTDIDAVRAVVSDVRPDVVYHLAAMTHVGDSWTNAVEFTRVNVLGTKNVLDATYDVAPDAKVVFVSSSEIYGVVSEDVLPLDEKFRTAPANPYSASKLEAELLAKEASRTRGQRVIIARPFNHVGPGQADHFVVPALVSRLFAALHAGQHEISVGDLSTRRDFSDVRDVVRAYRLLSEFGQSPEAYNVCSGHDTSILEVATFLQREIAPDVTFALDERQLRPVEIPVMRGSFNKLHETTGWEPSITLETSLRDVIAEHRSKK